MMTSIYETGIDKSTENEMSNSSAVGPLHSKKKEAAQSTLEK
jgi:hypothetical protein